MLKTYFVILLLAIGTFCSAQSVHVKQINAVQYPQNSVHIVSKGIPLIHEKKLVLLGSNATYTIDSLLFKGEDTCILHLYDLCESEDEELLDRISDLGIQDSSWHLETSVARDMIIESSRAALELLEEYLPGEDEFILDTLGDFKQNYEGAEIIVKVRTKNKGSDHSEYLLSKLIFTRDSAEDIQLHLSGEDNPRKNELVTELFIHKYLEHVIPGSVYDTLVESNHILISSAGPVINIDSVKESIHSEHSQLIYNEISEGLKYPALILIDEIDSMKQAVISRLNKDEVAMVYYLNSALNTNSTELAHLNEKSLDKEIVALYRDNEVRYYSMYFSIDTLPITLEFEDKIMLALNNEIIDSVKLSIPDEYLADRFVAHSLNTAKKLMDEGNFMLSLDTLKKSIEACQQSNACNSSQIEVLADQLLTNFLTSEIAAEKASAYERIKALEKEYRNLAGKEYKSAKRKLFSEILAYHWDRQNWNGVIEIGKTIRLTYGSNTSVDEKYAYAMYKAKTSMDSWEACEYLYVCVTIKPLKYTDELESCAGKALASSYKDGKYAQAYSNGSKYFEYIKNSAENRYNFAESARLSANYEAAYEQYIWIEKNWRSIELPQLKLEILLEKIREISLSTGDYHKAYELEKRKYLNSGNRNDLIKTICIYRMQYAGLISQTFRCMAEIVTPGKVLSDIKGVNPEYISNLKLTRDLKQDIKSATPFMYFPFSSYDYKNKSGTMIHQVAGGDFLIASTSAVKPVHGSENLYTALTENGYTKGTYDQLIKAEDAEGLKYFGSALKLMAGAILDRNEKSLNRYFTKVLNIDQVDYIAYTLGNSTSKLGNCPADNIYSGEYMNISSKVIQYESTSLRIGNKMINEIAIPLKKSGKRIGYVRVGIKNR